MKASRQETILRIISESDIENQSQLINALKRNGFNSTQATVSRDIRELRLVKELTSSGSYRYTTSPRGEILNYSSRLKAILKESVTSFDFAQNIVVIKTLPGLASAVCSALDGMKISDLVGTLAGDDTAFMVMRDEKSAELFCNDIHAIL
jgi:transcriptional regulator of arginine metabolism